MTDRTPKKSEMLEVRIPHPTKTAFMEKAHAEGRPASEIVRDSIDRYLAGDTPVGPLRSLGSLLRRRAKTVVSLAAAAVLALSLGVAISPASAQPDLRAAFAALDVDGDGAVSLAEFTDPQRALTSEIGAAQTVPATGVAVPAHPTGSPAYVRFALDTGTADGVVPLLIVVEMPKGGLSGADVRNLVGGAFARLDRNGDGRLTPDEFGQS